MTWRQIVDRSHGHIEQLAPTFRDRVGKWYAELLAKRIPVLVYCSVRTPKEQDELYAQGRSKKGTKVTNAKGTPVAQSFHCYGRAIDAVPASRNTAGEYTLSWDDETTYAVMDKVAEKHDMRTLTWERPHYEDADFKDWRQLAASESIGTRVAEANRRYMQEVESTPGGIPWPQNTRVSKGATKPLRKVRLRKP